MAFERIKALGARVTGSDQRYPDPDEEYTPPQEVDDPHTREAESERGWRGWLADNKLYVLSLSLFGFAAVVLVAVYAGRYLITFITNPWTQRAAAGLAIGGAGAYVGASRERDKLKRRDELTLYDPDERRSYHFLGIYKPVQGAAHDVFIPHKGHGGDHYRIKELSQDLVRRHGHDPEAPAKIRLHPGVSTIETTSRGRKVTQLTSGVSPDPFGRESNLEATLPDMAATDTVTDLKSELQKLDEELTDLRDRNDQLRRQRDNAREDARQARQEYLDEFQDVAGVIEPFVTRSSTGSNDGNEQSNGHQDVDELVDALTTDQ